MKKSFFIVIINLFCFSYSLYSCDVSYGCKAIQGFRERMEDRTFTVSTMLGNTSIEAAAVIDGHGGSQAAAEVCEKLFFFITEEYSKIPSSIPRDMQTILPRAFECMNNDLKKEEHLGAFNSQGCTASVSLLINNALPRLYIAHIGDSRIVDACGNALTNDHNLHNPTEVSRIPTRIIYETNNDIILKIDNNTGIHSLNITRVFGDFAFSKFGVSPQPELTIIPLNVLPKDKYDNKFIILCTDGIYDLLENNEVASIVSETLRYHSQNLDYVAKRIIYKGLVKYFNIIASSKPSKSNVKELLLYHRANEFIGKILELTSHTPHNTKRKAIGHSQVFTHSTLTNLIDKYGKYAHDNLTVVIQIFKD